MTLPTLEKSIERSYDNNQASIEHHSRMVDRALKQGLPAKAEYHENILNLLNADLSYL